MDAERGRAERAYTGALERLAKSFEDANDPSAAAPLLQKLIDIDPVSSKHAIALIRALMNAGDHAAALRYAERYEAIVARELGTSVGPAVSELVAEVRAQMKTESVVVRGVASPVVVRPDSEASMPVARAAETPKPSDEATYAAEPQSSRPAVVRRAVLWYGVAAVLVVALVGVAAQWRPRAAGSRPVLAYPSTTAPSIAVLPLANHSADPRDATLADGMTDELIARLSQVAGLRVIASIVGIRPPESTHGRAPDRRHAGRRLRPRRRFSKEWITTARSAATPRWARRIDALVVRDVRSRIPGCVRGGGRHRWSGCPRAGPTPAIRLGFTAAPGADEEPCGVRTLSPWQRSRPHPHRQRSAHRDRAVPPSHRAGFDLRRGLGRVGAHVPSMGP